MESRLFQALKAFKGAEGCEANLFEEFKKIAEAAFFSGYFLINGGCKDAYKLKLTCIEFYYHEDDGYIKDKIKYLKGKDEFGYALGAVCPNPSGVDVLFDDPQKKYHASFLIRGYKAIEPGKKEWENNEKEKIGLLMIFGMISLVEQICLTMVSLVLNGLMILMKSRAMQNLCRESISRTTDYGDLKKLKSYDNRTI